MDEAYIIFARDMWQIYHAKLYMKWGYETYGDYLRDEVGCSKDSAYRARRIFETFVHKCNLSPNSLEGIGRTKAQHLLPVVNKSNAKYWVDRAKRLTVDDLVSEIEDSKSEENDDGPSPVGPDKKQPQEPITVNAKGRSAEHKDERAVKKFRVRKFRLPDDSDDLLEEALGEAQRITDSHSAGFNLTCIAQFFLAHRLTSQGSNDGRLPWYLRQWEEVYGGRLIHVKDDKGWEILAEAVRNNPEHLGSSDKESINEQYDDDRAKADDSGGTGAVDRDSHEPEEASS